MNLVHPAVSWLLIAGLLHTSGVAFSAPAKESSPPSEYEVKAAFLYNFTKFIRWPEQAFSGATDPFVIVAFGEDRFGEALDQTFENKKVNGRSFMIRRVKNLSELKPCHMLFIGSSEKRHVSEALKAVSGQNVLTVSEMDRFIQSGGMVNFFMEGNKVRFEINDQAAKNAGLRISSKLLSLAKRETR